MSKDISDENTAAEEEYEVERIVGHKVIRYRKQRKFSYFIKWLNYPDADNTWEKEDNVFAVNMIAAYWNGIPPTDPDRILFEQLQAKKKDPIILNTPPQPKVAKVISHASPSPPSSPTLKPTNQTETTTEEPKRSTISNMLTSFLSGGKKKDTVSSDSSSSVASSSKAPIVSEQKKIDELYTKVPSPTPPINGSLKGKEREDGAAPKSPTPIVVDRLNLDDQEFSPATTSATTSSTDDLEAEVDVEDVESTEDMVVEVDEDEDEDEEDEVVKRPSRSATRKRTRSAYTDYFIEQHKKKKLYGDRKDTEDDDDEDDGSVASSIDSNDKKKPDNLKPTDTIIIDDSFSKDASLDWNKLAKKVEYIGREVENGPIYCVVSWEDEVRSFHSLDLVRKKRPDLVIDAFVASL